MDYPSRSLSEILADQRVVHRQLVELFALLESLNHELDQAWQGIEIAVSPTKVVTFRPTEKPILDTLVTKGRLRSPSKRLPLEPNVIVSMVIDLLNRSDGPVTTAEIAAIARRKSLIPKDVDAVRKIARQLSNCPIFQPTSEGWTFREVEIPPVSGAK